MSWLTKAEGKPVSPDGHRQRRVAVPYQTRLLDVLLHTLIHKPGALSVPLAFIQKLASSTHSNAPRTTT